MSVFLTKSFQFSKLVCVFVSMLYLTTTNVIGRYRGSKRKLWAGYRAPSLKRTPFFIVECCIARFMRVFKVRASSSSPRLPFCQISFLSRPPIAELARGEKSRTQSITHPAYLMPREPMLPLRKRFSTQ